MRYAMIFQHQCQSVFMLITTIKRKLPFPQFKHVERRCLSEWEMEKLEEISHTMHTHTHHDRDDNEIFP